MTASVTIVNTSNWDEPIRGRVGATDFSLARGQSIPIGLPADCVTGAEFHPLAAEHPGYLGELEVEVHDKPDVATEKHVQTRGEFRVGIGFNPSGDERVSHIKRLAADFIDACGEYKDARFVELHPDDKPFRPETLEVQVHEYDPGKEDQWHEIRRLLDRAADQVEDAAMNAVKAVTKRKRGEA